MSDLAKHISTLSPEQRAVLLRKLQQKTTEQQVQKRKTGIVQQQILPHKRENNNVVLSYAQERLWFLHQFDPQSPAYNISNALYFRGTLSVATLEHAFANVIQQHEALRTVFHTHDGKPTQVIAPSYTTHMPVIDLSEIAPEEQKKLISQLAYQEQQQPFNLATGPLLRIAMIRLDTQNHVLLFTLHHIIFDGWSTHLLVRELSQSYQAESQGKSLSPTPLPIQYADYALWQRQWLQGEVLEAQLTYWRTQLAGAAALDLPTDHPRPTIQSSQGASQSCWLPVTLSQQMQAMSQQQHVTLFMLLLASFQVLLLRYSGQTDISVGTPIANRRLPELEGLIGFFVNTLVLRSDLSGNPSFVDLLQQTREVCLQAYAHQDLPFEQIVETIAPERDLSRSPLFQVMFVLQNVPSVMGGDADIQMTPLEIENTISKFDLTLTVIESQQGLHCTFTYKTDLFDPETITRLLDHWQIMLHGLQHDPHIGIADVPLLTASEREHLLRLYHGARISNPQVVGVHQLFEQQVQRIPASIALVYEEHQISYEELDERANQLAHYLQQLGAGPEILIGICMERSLEMIIALLAILKTGGAYLPLAPDLPLHRISLILTDAHPAIILTQHEQQDPLLSTFVGSHFCFERDWQRLTSYSKEALKSKSHPTNLAYVLYTSGSTGLPKGVQIEHQQLLNYVQAVTHAFHLEHDHTFALLQPLAVDSSITVLFSSLCFGGCLHLIARESSLDPHTMEDYFQRMPIDCLKIAPSHLAALHSSVHPEWIMPRRHLIIGGEASSWQWVQTLTQLTKTGTVINHYGPTETTVGVLTHQIDSAREDWSAVSTPLERALANQQAYILDASMHPLPIGFTGELYIGGAGITRGYLGHPDLSAASFVPDPFSPTPGARLYRTGDLVRSHGNGLLEYLGRMDHQVKINGYRIELQEIEAVLGTHPAIQENVVMAREDTSGEKRLVAYLVGGPGTLPDDKEIRLYMQKQLPPSMIPFAFVRLDTLPLTPHGKLDRQALPAPHWNQEQVVETAEQAPLSPLEQIVAGVWSEVLGIDQIGRKSDFFTIGGHSLLATQVIGRLRGVLARDIPLRVLFETSTVAGMAHWIEQVQREGESSVFLPLEARPDDSALPLSFAQQRLWFLDQLEPESVAYLIPAALRIQGKLEVSALEASFQFLVQRHESLRTTFIERERQVIQEIHLTGQVRVSMLDLSGLVQEQREQEVRRLAEHEAHTPCDLTQGPLLRTTLIRLEPEEHVLLLTLHHIITDGWSNAILVRELMALYHATMTSQPAPLTPLLIQYADYALWQRQWLQGEFLEKQLAYWRTQLEAAQPLALPTDRPRPAVQAFQGASQRWQISPEITDGLQRLSRHEHVTLFMLLLASFQVLLLRYSGQSDISVGTPIANRQQTEAEQVIGFFTNTLVMRSDLSGNPSFVELLRRVRETCLGAYAHQDLPFEKVVEALEPVRDLSRSPLFQVMFVLQNVPSVIEEEAGIQIHPLEIKQTVSKFDLTLAVEQGTPGLHGTIEYSTELFEATTITRLLGHWQTILQGILLDPQVAINEIPLLAEAEHTLRLKWNATERSFPRITNLPQLFEQQVQHTPDAIALVFEEQQLSYGELNRRANQLAHLLRNWGVSPDILVGICLERSLALVVSLLAVLKAGGAYLPLDPSYPAERLAFMLEDADVHVLLTSSSIQPHLPAQHARVLSLDTSWSGFEHLSLDNPLNEIEPEHLAYMIYTSGSTGTPKGAMNTHQALCNRLLWMQETYQLTPEDRVVQKTPLSFDVSVWEFFWPLLTGAQLVMARPEGHRDPTYLAQLIAEASVTVLHFVPSMLQIFLAEAEAARSVRPRLVICSGEALPAELQRRFFAQLPAELHNLYGPTEAAIDVTSWHCLPDEEHALVPIGRPIANIQIHLLNASLQPVPVGAPGELYIGGIGLARGYWHRAELTAERFIPDPFSQEPGRRLYQTGDLARYRADGAIEFLGRLDHQVKLRGFRIELGEIEHALEQIEAIQEAVVLVREDQHGNKRLVAYLVVTEAETFSWNEVRALIQTKLPNYMVPAIHCVLEHLPLTPNGKVDRRALPAPEVAHQRTEGSLEEARTPLERLVQEAWMQVLGLPQIGIHENFFELGGHSLLVLQLRYHIRDIFQVSLPLRRFFDDALTIVTMAELVEEELVQKLETLSEEEAMQLLSSFDTDN